jgi:hypothetical protein
MKTIQTLRDDIYSLFNPGIATVPKEEDLETFASNLKKKLVEKLGKEQSRRLRMSNVGTPCARKLWYEINTPELGERLSPSTYIKFLFGDIIEELLLFLAKTAGHAVDNEQRVLELNGVRGSCDATIDGTLVDVKSASSRSFTKFEEGLKKEDDGFGYLTQLGLYDHSIVAESGNASNGAAFVAFDKQMGTIAVDVHSDLSDIDYPALVENRKTIVARPEPPQRHYEDEEFGKSGNRKLGLGCSYCNHKHHCWPGVRTFLYYNGPVFLTKVERLPDVLEVK